MTETGKSMAGNPDATWCTNQSCVIKVKCWRWIGFYEGNEIDPMRVRLYEGGEYCPHKILRLDEPEEALT